MTKGLTMRKITHDFNPSKYSNSPRANLRGRQKFKLNPNILKEHDNLERNLAELPTLENRIPKESYIENITELNDIESNQDAINRYLEKKYLAQEFIEGNGEDLARPENEFIPSLKFENLVNRILQNNYVEKKWYFPIHTFIDKIAKTIRPNKHLPNEVAHYKDYVTIRKVKWMNHLK